MVRAHGATSRDIFSATLLPGSLFFLCSSAVKVQLAARRKAMLPTTTLDYLALEQGIAVAGATRTDQAGRASTEGGAAHTPTDEASPVSPALDDDDKYPSRQLQDKSIENDAAGRPSFHPAAAESEIDSRFSPSRRDQARSNSSGHLDLLDLLVEVCAAPPPYSLGSGVAELGREACGAAMRAFRLLSVALFEVSDASDPAVAVRVAAVQAGNAAWDGRLGSHRGEEKYADGSAAVAAAAATTATGVAAMEDHGFPERERLGEGAVGTAAQSARPVCIEILRPSYFGLRPPPPPPPQPQPQPPVTTPSALTVLCVPVMVQAAPASTLGCLAGGSGDAGGHDAAPVTSVEVVGVLRAVRAGASAFAGDDARALSAFCGQLALAMVAERMLAERRAGAAADAAKEARAFRRKACRRMAGLFAEGSVAQALLQRERENAAAGAGAVAQVTPAVAAAAAAAEVGMGSPGAGEAEMLWGSVAGLAAQALGCERVDLLRVAPLAGGGGGLSGDPPLAELLSRRRPASRSSINRRSRDGLLEARASSRSMSSSSCRDNSSTREGGEETAKTLLCVPVLGASVGEPRGSRVVGGAGGSGKGRRGEGGAVTVCCAVNKGSGKSFDDVDEVRRYSSTIVKIFAFLMCTIPLVRVVCVCVCCLLVPRVCASYEGCTFFGVAWRMLRS